MKLQLKNKELIIGKRVTVGAGINGLAAVFGHLFPDHAPAIISAAVPLTLVTQLLIANTLSITK